VKSLLSFFSFFSTKAAIPFRALFQREREKPDDERHEEEEEEEEEKRERSEKRE
jgi:hypothetical protein